MGIKVETHPFYSTEGYRILYTSGNTLKKVWETLLAYGRRFRLLFNLSAYDTVLVQRSVTPLGPPIFEWLIVKVLGKQLVYDFDDAIWIPDPGSSPLVRALKWYSKVGQICRLATWVTVGNDYLYRFASLHTNRVVLIPTVVDTTGKYLPADSSPESTIVTVGWTGSHSTLPYLNMVEDALLYLQKNEKVRIKIIADVPPTLPEVDVNFVRWKATNEVEELNKIDVGIMPLRADSWSEGKCGFKAIQFMALGIPVVASPVGVNSTIISHGANGYLASTTEEWIGALNLLVRDAQLRKVYGQAARKKIEKQYSIQAVLPLWQRLFADLDK